MKHLLLSLLSSRRLLLALLVVPLLAATACVVFAYWTTNGTGSASATVATLAPPTNVSASSLTSGVVDVSWTDVPPNSGIVVTGYYVQRGTTSVCGSPSLPLPSSLTACEDTGVAKGSYTYTVTAVLRSWTASASTSVTVSAGLPSRLAFGQQPTNAVSQAAISPAVTVRIEDADGNVTSSNAVVSMAAASGPGTLGGTVTMTASHGVATFSSLTIARSGTYTLVASTASPLLSSPPSNSFTVTAGAASKLTVSGYPSSTVAGVAHMFTITAQDAFGNTDPTYRGTVHLTSTDAQATAGSGLPADYTFTSGDNGVHSTFSATLKTAGSQSIIATDSVTGSITGAQSGITVTAGAATKLGVSGYPSSTVAGVAHALTVTAQDPYGNIDPTYRGTVHFSSTDVQASAGLGLPADYTFVGTDNGVHSTFSATLKTTPASIYPTSSSQSITATDTATASITGTQSGIVVSPAAANSLMVRASNTPTPTAGAALDMVVVVEDSYGNAVSGYTGTVHFSSTDPQATLPADYTFTSGTGGDNGIHAHFSATLKTAGPQSITASDTVSPSITGSQTGLTVVAAATSKLMVSAYPSSTAAGVAHTFTVTAQDPYGNTDPTYRGIVHFTSSDGQAVLPADYTFTSGDNGVHTTFSVTLKTAGAQSITATDTATSSITGAQAGITVAPVGAATLTVSSGTSETAGTAFAVTVTAKDAFGNQATGYTGKVRFGLGVADASANGLSNYTFSTGSGQDNGQHTFSVTLTRATSGQSITVTDTVTGTITGTSGSITVAAGSVTSVTVASGSSQSATVSSAFANPLVALAKDTYGNVVPGATVTFTAPGSGASGTFAGGVTTATTNASGVATSAVFTANTAAGGPYNVTASSGTGFVNFALTNTAGSVTSVTVSSGSPQSATVNTAFANPLVALAKDTYGNVVPGATVTFTAPGSGASGTFGGGVTTATTNASGLATSAVFTANTTAGGPYNVGAASGTGSLNFALTNTPGPVSKLVFTTVPSGNQAASATATIGAYQVQEQDSFGNPVTAGSTVVNLSSSSTGTKFFSATSGGAIGSAITSVTIASGQSTSGNFYYADTKAGSPTLTAQATGIGTDGTTSPTVVAAAPAGLAFTNADHTLSCGSISSSYTCTVTPGLGNGASVKASVTFVDGFGNPAVESTTADSTINLSTPSKGSVSTSSLSILKGTSTSTVQLTLTKSGSNTASTTATFGAFSLTLSTN
jgi:hypothetical protein